MRGVAVNTTLQGRRVRMFFGHGALQGGMAIETKLPAFHLGQFLAFRAVRSVARGTSLVH